MNGKSYDRRAFFSKVLGASALAVGTIVLDSCTNQKDNTTEAEEKATFGKTNCDDLSGLSTSALAERKRLGYVNKSYVPGSSCGNCSRYLPPTKPGHCGGCQMFDGPVRITGYCIQYDPIASNTD